MWLPGWLALYTMHHSINVFPYFDSCRRGSDLERMLDMKVVQGYPYQDQADLRVRVQVGKINHNPLLL